MWGAEDLIASLGGSSSRIADGGYRAVALHARSSVLLAAGAHDKAAIDSVFLAIADHDRAGRRGAGCRGVRVRATACIHPARSP